MENIEAMRLRHKEEIEELQLKCKHRKLTDWMEEQWAPGHSSGRKVKLCKFCNKVIKTKGLFDENGGEIRT